MTLSDLRLPCEHGEYFEHPDDIWDYHTGHIVQVRECPGGRPATLEDLGGEKVWWCEEHSSTGGNKWCKFYFYVDRSVECRVVERILLDAE